MPAPWHPPGEIRGDKERAALEQAGQLGYLRLFGRGARRRRLEEAWLLDCWSSGRPCIMASVYRALRPRVLYGRVSVELFGAQWMTRRLVAELKARLADPGALDVAGRSFTVSISGSDVEGPAALIREVLSSYRPTDNEVFDHPPRLVDAWARCVYAEAYEDQLTEGHEYPIREIPNMDGHVVVFAPGCLPLVGIHLDRFVTA